MLKLMKYEYRRKVTPYLILISIFVALYLYGIISLLTKSKANIAISMAMFSIGAIFGVVYIMILAIDSYSKELRSKSSYMTFMTPNSSYKIVGSKILSTFVASVVLTIIYLFLFYTECLLLNKQFPELEFFKTLLYEMTERMGYNIGELWISVILIIISIWLTIFMIICMAYFAITLSATILANKKGRGFISLLIFGLLFALFIWIGTLIPSLNLGDELIMSIVSQLPSYLFDLVIMIGSFFGAAYLLDKRVSL